MVYFLFLYIAVVSLVALTNVKLASISCSSSFSLWLTLVIHCSVSAVNVACSRLMYSIVVVISLCPSMYLTCIMSLVMWYSIVPLKCLSVWNPIFNSLGFFSLLAVLCLWLSNTLLIWFCLFGNMCSLVCGYSFSIAVSLSVSGRILGLLPFSGVMFTVLFCRFMSVHFSSCASPILIPVSLSSCRSVASLCLHDAIKMSISDSVGINGSVSSALYFGCSHLSSLNFKYAPYW